MKNHLQEIIAENISKKYGFEKEKILCFFDKNPYVNCIFPYAVMTAIQKSLGASSLSDILTEYERSYYLLDDELEPVALRKNEFVIRDSSFANHGIEEGYIIKYDPYEVYFGDYQAVELDGVIIPAFVTNERDGKCELYFEDDAYQSVTVFTDKIRFLGKLVGYRNPDEFYFRDFIEDEYDDEDYDKYGDETEY